MIHGGPTGVSRPAPYGSASFYPIDGWLAKGALVLEPNYRGSAGYGEAFRSLNVRNLGIGDAWDVLSGIDHLVAQGLVDKDRVGSMGWSQGGYISAFLATRHAERFKALSVGAGISNWVTYYVNTDIHPFTRQYLKATPWDDMKIYADTSPMTYIKQAKTPTLIQHGDKDPRVPIPNAFELYQGLQDQKVPVELMIFRGFGHGLDKPKANRAAMQQNWDWFGKYLWPDNAATGAADKGEVGTTALSLHAPIRSPALPSPSPARRCFGTDRNDQRHGDTGRYAGACPRCQCLGGQERRVQERQHRRAGVFTISDLAPGNLPRVHLSVACSSTSIFGDIPCVGPASTSRRRRGATITVDRRGHEQRRGLHAALNAAESAAPWSTSTAAPLEQRLRHRRRAPTGSRSPRAQAERASSANIRSPTECSTGPTTPSHRIPPATSTRSTPTSSCPTYCNDSDAAATGTPIPVTLGATTAGINFALARGASIAGPGHRESEPPRCRRRADRGLRPHGELLQQDTDSAGDYVTPGLVAGTVLL